MVPVKTCYSQPMSVVDTCTGRRSCSNMNSVTKAEKQRKIGYVFSCQRERDHFRLSRLSTPVFPSCSKSLFKSDNTAERLHADTENRGHENMFTVYMVTSHCTLLRMPRAKNPLDSTRAVTFWEAGAFIDDRFVSLLLLCNLSITLPIKQTSSTNTCAVVIKHE